jgi:3-deoxy-D-manno-octulosonate 8-phosphate phosphatase KdsC-like HAD superfamily phosphatase
VGTNYYLHLGKRSSIGDGRCSFTWAVPPVDATARIIRLCATVRDEYGGEQTLAEFMGIISEDQQQVDHIGERFS